MPVDVTSRYWALAGYDAPGETGPTTAIAIRPNAVVADEDLVNHRLTGVETIEYVAWRYYGRSAAWWRIADANPLAFPLDYRPGATLKVPPGRAVGRVVRTRSL